MGEVCREKSKTLLELSDSSSILTRTLRSILDSQVCKRIVIAVRPEDEPEIRAVLATLRSDVPIDLVPGGATRQDSVASALAAVDDPDGFVFVHDAARPFCPPEKIQDVCRSAQISGAAILALPVKPTLKEVGPDHHIRRTVPRTMIWEAQTPQAFKLSVLLDAHEKARADAFQGTDESELVERLGVPVTVVFGSEQNVKITSPGDLLLAEAISRAIVSSVQRSL